MFFVFIKNCIVTCCSYCIYPIKERCFNCCETCDKNLNPYKKPDYDPYLYL